MTRTHNIHIFGEIPFVKPQNDTKATVKRLEMMKNESEIYLFLVELSLVQRLEDCWHDNTLRRFDKRVFVMRFIHII